VGIEVNNTHLVTTTFSAHVYLFIPIGWWI
jgi:hypothetical protein